MLNAWIITLFRKKLRLTNHAIVFFFSKQVHRGIKGIVKDGNGNGIKDATISIRGVRKDVTTGIHNYVSI